MRPRAFTPTGATDQHRHGQREINKSAVRQLHATFLPFAPPLRGKIGVKGIKHSGGVVL
jgi:hypothetical protein